MSNISVQYVPLGELRLSEYNPRRHPPEAAVQLKESIKRFGFVDPVIVNKAPERMNVVIGGHFRLKVAQELGIESIPVVYIEIVDLAREKELNVRLNKNTGEFDLDLVAQFDEAFLLDVGFTSEELDDIFPIDVAPNEFDLEKELAKLNIESVTVQAGDVYELGGSRLMCGDSMKGEDVQKLMGGEKADMCFTDPPYILDYLDGKKKKKNVGFGHNLDRRYLGTDELPSDFSNRWMANVHEIQNEHFSIIVYENWKNVRIIWNAMEKFWKVRNMLIWHAPNRSQRAPAHHRFFNKYDIAMVGTAEESVDLNIVDEEELFQNEYTTALYAISGSPQWEGYEKGRKIQPTDFLEHKVADAKSSGQSIIFGTKPIELLIPYIKVLTKRDDLIIEPFGGSGSTLIAATKMKRRCFLMEKSPVYAEVIMNRWEKLTGNKRHKLDDA